VCALSTIKTPRKDIQFLIRKRLKRTEGWVKEHNRRLNGSDDREIKGLYLFILIIKNDREIKGRGEKEIRKEGARFFFFLLNSLVQPL